MLLSSRPFVFVVDQLATSTSLMLLGFRPFVFVANQIVASTSTSILMLLGSRSFFVVDQVVATFLCPIGFWAFYFVANQTTTASWVCWGVFVGMLLQVACVLNLVIKACVTNQSQSHGLLSDVLTTFIVLMINMEVEFEQVFNEIEVLDEFDVELLLQHNMQ
jgi:hypothetical protein